ncbi:MAG: carboxypeptidase regulatory-like domain-containing protein [Acidobacteria bacterium]|nr:carboxypeptidase regulatory-like domain-containing protein [Acidobacteriota bacterium]
MTARRIVYIVGAVLLLGASIKAQSTFGTILGKVTDPSGLVMAGAEVTVTNLDENVFRQVSSDQLGNYEVLNLKAGRYSVVARAKGFRQYKLASVVLESRAVVRVDVPLSVGEVEQEITVSAAAAVITTDTATISSRFDGSEIKALPLGFRGGGTTTPFGLFAVLPGVQAGNGSEGSLGYSLSVQGALPDFSDATVDGISIMDIRLHRPAGNNVPSTEGIAELRVQGVGNSAEFMLPGELSIFTKGGTNQFHGSVFEYHQNRALDATQWGASAKPKKIINTFGASLGGPLIRNRTFFLGSFEGVRYPSSVSILNTVPTAAMRGGDFSQEPNVIRDPLTGLQFTGNRIPSNRISAPSAAILSRMYPSANFGNTTVLTPNNYRVLRNSPADSMQYDVRLDHVFTEKQSVFARWTNRNFSQLASGVLLAPGAENYDEERSLAGSYNYAIRPTLLNEFRGGLNYVHRGQRREVDVDGKKFAGEVGLTGYDASMPTGGLPQIGLSSVTGLSVSVPRYFGNGTLQVNDNLTWIKGRHTLKFGVGFRRTYSDQIEPGVGSYGNFAFTGSFSGNDFADFLLGIPNRTTISWLAASVVSRSLEQHYFVQDSFRMSPKLTMELGIRWDINGRMQFGTGDASNFDRTLARAGRIIYPSSPEAAALTAPSFLQAINACPRGPVLGVPCTPFLTAKEAGWPETLIFPDRNNFNPRLGFAYRPTANNKTVFRGSFGMFTLPLMATFSHSLTNIHSDGNNTEYTNAILNGRPLYQWPQIRSGSGTMGAGVVGTFGLSTMVNPHFRDPYGVQWSMTGERELGWGTGLRVSYIGMHSLKMSYSPDLNQLTASTAPYSSRPATDRPFPNFSRIWSRENGGTAMYHSLQTEVNRRFSSTLTFNAAYTLANSKADYMGSAPGSFTNENGARALDAFDRHSDWGNVVETPRHRFVGSMVFSVPAGKGRRYLSNANRATDYILGGWRIGNIYSAQSGRFLTPVQSSGDPSGTNGGGRTAQRPDALSSGQVGASMDNWWNRSAFACAGATGGANQWTCGSIQPGRFGNARVGSLTGPAGWAFNTSFGKDFRITERVTMKFESVWMNLLNHPIMGDPNNVIESQFFGKISSKSGNRVGQFSLRLEY